MRSEYLNQKDNYVFILGITAVRLDVHNSLLFRDIGNSLIILQNLTKQRDQSQIF